MTSPIRIFRFLPLILSALVAQGQQIALFVDPTDDHRPIAYCALNSDALDKATPVLETARTAQGWFWAEYSGPFEGFIEAADLGTDDRPKKGAVVYSEPNRNAPIVTTIEDRDRGVLSSPNGQVDFIAVPLNKTIGIYFNMELRNSAPSTPAARPQVREAPPVIATSSAPPPPPVVQPPPPRQVVPTPVADTQPTSEASLRSDHMLIAESSGSSTKPPQKRSSKVEIIEREITRSTPVSNNSITLRGVLAQSKQRWFLFSPPTAYRLLDANGGRIAWIELDDAILARPLIQLLDHDVILYGEWTRVGDDSTLVLHCRSVRLAF